jgi:hypothetical protein
LKHLLIWTQSEHLLRPDSIAHRSGKRLALQNSGCFMVSEIMSIGAGWMDALSDGEKFMRH